MEELKWQACPVCNGTGEVLPWGYYITCHCHVCGGKGIIPTPTEKEYTEWQLRQSHPSQ